MFDYLEDEEEDDAKGSMFDYLDPPSMFDYVEPKRKTSPPRPRSLAETLIADPVRAAAAAALRLPDKAVDFVDFLQQSTGPLKHILPAGLGQFNVARARRENQLIEGLAEKVEPPAPTNTLGKVSQAVGGAVPDVAAMIAGGPVAGTAYMGGLISGQSFKEAKGRGVSTPVAATKAIGSGAIGAFLERFGAARLGALLRPLSGPGRGKFTRQLLRSAGVEGGTEGAQEAVEIALEAATGKEFAEGEITERMTIAPLAGAAMAGPVGLASVVAPRSRQTAGREVHDAAERYLTTQAGLDQQEQLAIEKARNESAADLMEARQVALELSSEIRRQAPRPGPERIQLQEAVQSYITSMDGNAPPLPPRIQVRANQAREMLDLHTERFLDSEWLTEDQRTVLEVNLGSYMRRSFQIHDDPVGRLAEVAPHIVADSMQDTDGLVEMDMDGEVVLTTPEWLAARNWLAQEEPNASAVELDGQLRNLFEIPQPSSPNRGAYVSPDVQMIERSPFMRRQDLGQEILDLFGEHRIPEVSFIKSIERTAHAYHRAEMYQALLQGGLMKGLLSPTRTTDAWKSLQDHGSATAEELVRMQEINNPRDDGSTAPRVFTARRGARNVETAGGGEVSVPVDRVAQRPDLYVQPNWLKSLDIAMNSNPWFGVKADAKLPVKGYVAAAKTAGGLKAGLTVFQLQAQMRNLQSNIIAVFAGGNLTPLMPWDSPSFQPVDADGAEIAQPVRFKMVRQIARAAGVAAQANELIGPRFARMAPELSADLRQESVRLARLGARGGSVDAGEMEFFAGEALSRMEGSGSRVRQGLAKIPRLAQKLYVAGDDVAKATLFYRERQKLLWLYETELSQGTVTEQQIDAEAAEMVSQTGQNYNRLPQLAKDLRAIPLTAPFIAFPVASMTNLKNQAKRVFQEFGAYTPDETSLLGAVRPSRGKMTAIAAGRLGGLAVATMGVKAITQGLVLAAREGISKTLGTELEPIADVSLLPYNDGETVEDMLEAKPWWSLASNHVVLHKSGGKIWSLDLSYMNYFNYMERPLLAAVRSGQFDESAFDAAIGEIAQPFVSRDIFAGAILQVLNNEDQYGNPIYTKIEDGQGKPVKGDEWQHTKKALEHLALSFAGPLKTTKRLSKAWNDEGDSLSGNTYNLWTEMLALGGPRIEITDFERTLSHRSRDAKEVLGELRASTNRVLKEPGIVNPEAAQIQLQADFQASTMVYKRLQSLYQAGIRQGASKEALDVILLTTKLSKEEVAGVMQGHDPAEMAKRWIDKALPSANKARAKRGAQKLRAWRASHPDATPEEIRQQREALSKLWGPVALDPPTINPPR